MPGRSAACLAAAVATVVGGCGGDDFSPAPADVAGNYTVSVRNGSNGCGFDNWTEGETAEGIRVVITQEGAQATAAVEGLPGLILGAVVGSNELDGTVDGVEVSLSVYGTLPHTLDQCTYTLNAFLDATIDGDAIAGTLTYTPAESAKPECAAIAGCVNEQTLVGTRPPSR